MALIVALALEASVEGVSAVWVKEEGWEFRKGLAWM